MFLEYLANHAMFVDVWDGDSLHLIGTATLQLKELLRQGREAVQSTFELDVISVEYDDDSRLYSGNAVREKIFFSLIEVFFLNFLFSTKTERLIQVTVT